MRIDLVWFTVGDLCEIGRRGLEMTESVSVLDEENELHRPLCRRSGEMTNGIIPQKPLAKRELPFPVEDDEELEEEEQEAALDTAEDEVLWVRGGGVGLFFLFSEIPLLDKHESVEWSRELADDFPLVISCWEKVTLDGGLIDACDFIFASWLAPLWSDPLMGEINAWRTMKDREGDGQLLERAFESVVDWVEQILVRVLAESKTELVRLRVSKGWLVSRPSI